MNECLLRRVFRLIPVAQHPCAIGVHGRPESVKERPECARVPFLQEGGQDIGMDLTALHPFVAGCSVLKVRNLVKSCLCFAISAYSPPVRAELPICNLLPPAVY